MMAYTSITSGSILATIFIRKIDTHDLLSDSYVYNIGHLGKTFRALKSNENQIQRQLLFTIPLFLFVRSIKINFGVVFQNPDGFMFITPHSGEICTPFWECYRIE